MSEPVNFKLEVEHDFTVEPDYHEWVDVGPQHTEWARGITYEVRLDAMGRQHPNGWRKWRTLICNNPECTGVARYRVAIVTDLAAAWDATR